MTAVVYATPGKLYLSPTNATTGGTQIAGIEERLITLSVNSEVIVRRTGVGVNAGFVSKRGRVEPAILALPLRDQSTTALKMLFAHLTTDGATFRPTGGTATSQHRSLPTFALVLRPDNTSEKYLYGPKWSLAPDMEQAITWSDDGPQLSSSSLLLIANGSGTSGVPEWMWDTAANINTAYSL